MHSKLSADVSKLRNQIESNNNTREFDDYIAEQKSLWETQVATFEKVKNCNLIFVGFQYQRFNIHIKC